MQEKIADEMVRMAQSLKHTSQMASNIIKEDNKVFILLLLLFTTCSARINLVFLKSVGDFYWQAIFRTVQLLFSVDDSDWLLVQLSVQRCNRVHV